jgi:hypothetical protein
MVEEGEKMYTTGIRLIQKAARRWMHEQRDVRLDGQKWEHQQCDMTVKYGGQRTRTQRRRGV